MDFCTGIWETGVMVSVVAAVQANRPEVLKIAVSVKSKKVFMTFLSVSTNGKEREAERFLRRGLTRIGFGFDPFTPEKSVKQSVLDFAVYVPALAEEAFTLKAETFEKDRKSTRL